MGSFLQMYSLLKNSIIFLIFISISNSSEANTIGVKDLSSRYSKILTEYGDFREKPLCINEEKPECISVYIVKSEYIKNNGSQRIFNSRQTFSDLDFNAIFTPPKTIVIDERLLDILLLDNLNRRTFMMLDKEAAKFTERPPALHAYASFQLMLSLRKDFNKSNTLMNHWVPIQEVVDGYLEDINYDDRESVAFTSLAFSFLIEHEISHLNNNSNYISQMKFKIKSLISEEAWLDEERNADFNAIKNTKENFSRLLNGSKATNEALKKYNKEIVEGASRFFFTENLFSYARVLRDISIYKLYSKFKPFPFEYSFFHTEFLECSARDKFSYIDPRTIEDIFENHFPLLSHDEFKEISNEYKNSYTHDHNFIRYKNILDFIKSESDMSERIYSFDNGDKYVKSLNALRDKKPQDFFTFKSNDIQPIPSIDLNSLLTKVDRMGFSEVLVSESCSYKKCFSVRKGKEVIEIYSEKGEVYLVKWLTNIKGKTEDYIEKMITMMDFLLFITGLPDFSSNEAKSLSSLRDPTFKCGYGSAFVNVNDVLFFSSSVNTDGTVMFTMLSSK